MNIPPPDRGPSGSPASPRQGIPAQQDANLAAVPVIDTATPVQSYPRRTIFNGSVDPSPMRRLAIQLTATALNTLPRAPSFAAPLQSRSQGQNRSPTDRLPPALDLANIPRLQRSFLSHLASTNHRRARQIGDTLESPTAALADNVIQWLSAKGSTETAATHARWREIASEGGALAFNNFFARLTSPDTVNADNPAFRQQTSALLTQVGDDPVLRQQVFAISVSATTSCEDRVSQVFVTMLAAARAARFNQTHFASDTDAVSMQRQFHRLALLHDLAHTIVTETGNAKEEIETHLHLLLKHVDALALADMIPPMALRFAACASVSAERDATIVPTIKQQENHQFAQWLAQSPSWLGYIERQEKPRFDAASDARDSAFEEQFQSRLDAHLASTGLDKVSDPNAWSDAERVAGKVITSEIMDEVYGALTKDFLAARNGEHLLDAYWPETECTATAHAV